MNSKLGFGATATVAAMLILFFILARGPDFDLRFDRDIPSKLSAEQLGRELTRYSQWKHWYYGARTVEVKNSGTEVKTGDVVNLKIDPRKGPWKRFEIQLKVTEFVPASRLKMHVLDDSKGKLTQLFDTLDWTVEILPGKSPAFPSIVRGTATARTRHWRSRLFARVSPRILMNQVYYPDLLTLAGMKEAPTFEFTPR